MLTQPWPATSSEKSRGIPDRVIYHQFRHDRARRTLRGIDEQVAKAEKAVDGHAPLKCNRFIKLNGATKTVNRELEAKERCVGGVDCTETGQAGWSAGMKPIVPVGICGSLPVKPHIRFRRIHGFVAPMVGGAGRLVI